MRREIICVHCGRTARANEGVDPAATWWLCAKCTCQLSQTKPDKLAQWYREALKKYAETGNKAYLRFARNFLEPCVGTRLASLKAVREKQGLTIRELADKLGVKHSFIVQIEQGQKSLPDSLCKKLAKMNLI